MNSNAGYGSSGIPYEVTVAEAKSKALAMKKVLLVCAYVFYAGGLLLLGSTTKLILPLLALIPITLWIIVFFTWRYTQVQYEYSLFAGEMTVSRILGDRFRKVLVKVRITELASVLPCGEESADAIARFAAEDTVFAASAENAEGLYVALWKDSESGKKRQLFFEPDERAVKILRYYNAAAMTQRK